MEIKNWFSSDWHLGHNNILKYDNRPFKDIDHHDQVIIDNYNSIVGNNDNFYFLGDFALTDSRYVKRRLSELKGNKFFIKGNHDKHDTIKAYEANGTYLGEQKKIVIDGQAIILNHFAMRVWDKSHKGSHHLYAHNHGGLEQVPWGKSMDVCIILNDYYPFEWEQIKKILDAREAFVHHEVE
jgi:calcineurin-like phosphoesterase family protein